MAMNIKKIFCCISCFVLVISVGAQNPTDAVKNIGKIKRDSRYLYAETTMKDLSEAYNGAKSILEAMVSDWIHEQYPNEDIDLCLVKAKEHCLQIQTRRGDYYRAFVYVKKSDIIPIADRNEVTVFQVGPKEEAFTNVPSLSPAIAPPTPVVTLTDEERRMSSIRQFEDIEPYVKELQQSGKVIRYGKYATMPAKDNCHLFIYDKEGKVRAVLRKENTILINLVTQKEDYIKNYKNCGAIWFQLKPIQE